MHVVGYFVFRVIRNYNSTGFKCPPGHRREPLLDYNFPISFQVFLYHGVCNSKCLVLFYVVQFPGIKSITYVSFKVDNSTLLFRQIHPVAVTLWFSFTLKGCLAVSFAHARWGPAVKRVCWHSHSCKVIS